MLKTRIIPTMLWKNIGLVKGVGFNSWRRVGTVMPAIKVYNTREVDELFLVDISATSESSEPDIQMLADISRECFVPLTVGGGIKSVESIRRLLHAGADKIAINSNAYSNPQLIKDASQCFGSQCIVVSIDVRQMENGKYECISHSGQRSTGRLLLDWLRQVEDLGAGEILITSIERDGTMSGYDLDLIQQVSNVVKIPVIASGGAGNYEHMYQALLSGASAVAAASIFHFTEQTPLGAKRYLAERGINIRNSGVAKGQ